MSRTAIINCDVCKAIFEHEEEDDEEFKVDICRDCFFKVIIPLIKDKD